MTLDRSLKIHGGLVRSRSVLTRAERIERLIDEGKFDPEQDSPLGLPKVRVRHSKAGTKTKKEEKPAEVAAEGAEAAEAAQGAAAGAGEKPAREKPAKDKPGKERPAKERPAKQS
jgi:small basic protein (TIGR04137 family)